jgi:transketolase
MHRLGDVNHSQLKLVCTHCGLDVGEDGKTHQCIDYVGVFANLFGCRVITPADANQADRAVRYMAREPGSFLLATGRSKLPVIEDSRGRPAFAGGYEFEYGKATLLRGGPDAACAVLAMGQVTSEAVKAAETLEAEGVPVQVWCVSSPLEIDREALARAASTGAVVTAEDHHVRTGLGAQVARALAEEGHSVGFRALGVTGFACSGDVPTLYAEVGIDAEGIAAAARDLASSAKRPAKKRRARKKSARKQSAPRAKKAAEKTARAKRLRG